MCKGGGPQPSAREGDEDPYLRRRHLFFVSPCAGRDEKRAEEDDGRSAPSAPFHTTLRNHQALQSRARAAAAYRPALGTRRTISHGNTVNATSGRCIPALPAIACRTLDEQRSAPPARPRAPG